MAKFCRACQRKGGKAEEDGGIKLEVGNGDVKSDETEAEV